MIRLTRFRQNDPIYLNPDLIERLDRHHQTIVRLVNGTEYVVEETPDEIVAAVTQLRASAIALAAKLAIDEVPPGVERRSPLGGVRAAAAVHQYPPIDQQPDPNEEG
jgi:flagellar protein FlbD